jgi:hypothetical protein
MPRMAAATHGEGKADVLATARCAADRQDDRQRLEAANDPGQEIDRRHSYFHGKPAGPGGLRHRHPHQRGIRPASYGELDQDFDSPDHYGPPVLTHNSLQDRDHSMLATTHDESSVGQGPERQSVIAPVGCARPR